MAKKYSQNTRLIYLVVVLIAFFSCSVNAMHDNTEINQACLNVVSDREIDQEEQLRDVDEYLDNGADINHVNSDGQSLIMLAAATGRLLLVRYLHECGADLTLSDNNHDRLLHHAAAGGNCAIIQFVIGLKSRRGNPLFYNNEANRQDGSTPLMAAAHKNRLDAIKLLLTINQDAAFTRDHAGNTIFHYAVRNAGLSLIEYLLEWQHPITGHRPFHADLAGENGGTPLLFSTSNHNSRVLERLFHATHFPQRTDRDGVGLLHYAARRGRHIQYVLKLRDRFTNALLFDVNDRDDDDNTPIMDAARFGHGEVVQQLVLARADITHTNNDGRNVLHWAVRNNERDALAYILNLRDASGGRILNLDTRTHSGETALMDAAYFGYLEPVVQLIIAGAPINSIDDTGLTALHHAIQERHLDIARVLVRAGANLLIEDDNGQTPLTLARTYDEDRVEHEPPLESRLYDWHAQWALAIGENTWTERIIFFARTLLSNPRLLSVLSIIQLYLVVEFDRRWLTSSSDTRVCWSSAIDS